MQLVLLHVVLISPHLPVSDMAEAAVQFPAEDPGLDVPKERSAPSVCPVVEPSTDPPKEPSTTSIRPAENCALAVRKDRSVMSVRPAEDLGLDVPKERSATSIRRTRSFAQGDMLKYRRSFDLFDLEKNGRVCITKLPEIIKRLGYRLNSKQIQVGEFLRHFYLSMIYMLFSKFHKLYATIISSCYCKSMQIHHRKCRVCQTLQEL